MSLEIRYTDEEEKRVWETICTLRQMRCAGENVQKGREEFDIQEILKDAEKLAKSPASYLIQLLEGVRNLADLDGWQAVQAEMDEKYKKFPMIRRSPFGIPLFDFKSALSRMRLNIAGELGLDSLTEHFVKWGKLGNIRFEDLFNDRLGILAPLSTDILTASLLPTFIRRHHSTQIPQVKPVLASTDLTAFSFPESRVGRPVFAHLDKILAFVDANGMGNTRLTLAAAAELEYPGKVIPTGSQYPIIGY